MSDFLERVDDFLERVAHDPVHYAVRLIVIFILLVLVILSTGCSQVEKKPMTGVCALKPIAERGGVTYLQYHCEPD